MKNLIIIIFSVFVFTLCIPTYAEVTSKEVITKYPNGAIKSKSTLKDGKQEGLDTRYYESGAIKQKSTYKAGLIHGGLIEYHTTGKINYK